MTIERVTKLRMGPYRDVAPTPVDPVAAVRAEVAQALAILDADHARLYRVETLTKELSLGCSYKDEYQSRFCDTARVFALVIIELDDRPRWSRWIPRWLYPRYSNASKAECATKLGLCRECCADIDLCRRTKIERAKGKRR